jgi:hypothetical protein
MHAAATENGRDSSQAFCAYAGIEFVEVNGTKDIDFKNNRIPINEFKQQKNPYTYAADAYMERFSQEYRSVRDTVLEGINKFNANFVLTCLGILHPFHVLTHLAVNEIGYRTWYWADLPYANKQYGKQLISSLLSDFDIVNSFDIPEVKVKEKLSLFRKFYKTESISWDEPGMYKNPEIVFEARHES